MNVPRSSQRDAARCPQETLLVSQQSGAQLMLSARRRKGLKRLVDALPRFSERWLKIRLAPRATVPYTWSVFQLSVPRNSLKNFIRTKIRCAHFQRSALTIVVLCTCDVPLANNTSGQSPSIRTEEKNFREHIQLPVLTFWCSAPTMSLHTKNRLALPGVSG